MTDTDAFVALFGVTPGFFAFVVVVAFVGFVVSATFGIGGVVLLIPALSMRLPPAQAVALSAPVMLISNLSKGYVYRRALDKKALVLVSGLAVPTAFFAALMTAGIDDRIILLAVAALIVASVVVERVRARPVKLSDRALLLWGLVTGVISGIAGAAGPPTAIGLKGYGLTREAFVATVAVFAVLLQLAKIPAYWATSALSPKLLPLALVLGLLAIVAVIVGPPLLRRLPERAFLLGVDAILLLSAGWILVEVLKR